MNKDSEPIRKIKTDEELLNRIILSRRGIPFSKNDILLMVRKRNIKEEVIDATLSRLIRKGIVVRLDSNKYLVKSIHCYPRLSITKEEAYSRRNNNAKMSFY